MGTGDQSVNKENTGDGQQDDGEDHDQRAVIFSCPVKEKSQQRVCFVYKSFRHMLK